MKYLLTLVSLIFASMPVKAETVYLIYKSSIYDSWGNAVTLHSIPMPSTDHCEEVGAELMSSKRFEIRKGKDAFECISGQ